MVVGEVTEWLKEHAWKACVLEKVPRVRIPLSPLGLFNDLPEHCSLYMSNPVRSGKKQR